MYLDTTRPELWHQLTSALLLLTTEFCLLAMALKLLLKLSQAPQRLHVVLPRAQRKKIGGAPMVVSITLQRLSAALRKLPHPQRPQPAHPSGESRTRGALHGDSQASFSWLTRQTSGSVAWTSTCITLLPSDPRYENLCLKACLLESCLDLCAYSFNVHNLNKNIKKSLLS